MVTAGTLAADIAWPGNAYGVSVRGGGRRKRHTRSLVTGPLPGPLGEGDGGGVPGARRADIGDRELAAGTGVRHLVGQAGRVADGGAVDRGDHVTAGKAGLLSRRVRDDLADQRARVDRRGEQRAAGFAGPALGGRGGG